MVRLVTADEDGLVSAAFFLRAGEAVVVPTDTVYGIAVDPTVPGSTQALFDMKGRRRDVPIAVLVAEERRAWSLGAAPIPEAAVDLAGRWWPGPLTVVIRRCDGWTADLGDETGTVAVRCPAHDWVRALCAQVGPLATTSANLHGEPTPAEAADVASLFDDAVSLVVDGGPAAGRPSTVVDCTVDPPRVLREGAIPASRLTL